MYYRDGDEVRTGRNFGRYVNVTDETLIHYPPVTIKEWESSFDDRDLYWWGYWGMAPNYIKGWSKHTCPLTSVNRCAAIYLQYQELTKNT